LTAGASEPPTAADHRQVLVVAAGKERLVMTSETARAPKPRLGGRSARVRAAVLNAAFAELGEQGYDGFSVEAVAQRSGVHKTTVYRRWPTRDALIMDALDSRSDRHAAPPPDTGSLRGDLRAFGEEVVARLTAPHGKALLKSLVAAVDASPEVLEQVRRFWRERLDVGAAVIARGISRGELPPDTDADLVTECFLAPVYLRVLLSRQPVTGDVLERVSDLLVDGAVPRVPA
jgi:AcrR family transcriptional regulator